MKHKVLKTALYVVLALVGVITVFPFVWMVLSSFKTNGEIQSIVQTLLPQEPTTDNYMNLQQTFDFLRYFMNSIFIAVAVTVLVIYTSCLCGYVLGKYQFKGKNNEFQTFHKLVLPLCKNGISAIAIFQFLWVWEDYLWPYLMIDSEGKQLLAVGLTLFNGRYSTDYGGLFAATTISILPVIIVYVIFQKRFVAGVAAGAVKG